MIEFEIAVDRHRFVKTIHIKFVDFLELTRVVRQGGDRVSHCGKSRDALGMFGLDFFCNSLRTVG